MFDNYGQGLLRRKNVLSFKQVCVFFFLDEAEVYFIVCVIGQ